MTEPTKLTLYADGEPYQVIDLKDIGDMSEEKTHYETIEELTMSKYYNYEVEEEEEEEKPRDETDWGSVIFGVSYWGILFGILIFAIVKVVNGG